MRIKRISENYVIIHDYSSYPGHLMTILYFILGIKDRDGTFWRASNSKNYKRVFFNIWQIQ